MFTNIYKFQHIYKFHPYLPTQTHPSVDCFPPFYLFMGNNCYYCNKATAPLTTAEIPTGIRPFFFF